MTITERLIYGVIGAVGTAGVAVMAQLFWLDEIRWPITGGAGVIGGIVGFVVCDKIWELLRIVWESW